MNAARPTPSTDVGRPLAACAAGDELVMVGAEAGCALRGRLAAMGLVPGVHLRVLRRDRRGPVVIALHGTRLAVGRGIAERILVRPAAP